MSSDSSSRGEQAVLSGGSLSDLRERSSYKGDELAGARDPNQGNNMVEGSSTVCYRFS